MLHGINSLKDKVFHPIRLSGNRTLEEVKAQAKALQE
jgi:hypothetical protein